MIKEHLKKGRIEGIVVEILLLPFWYHPIRAKGLLTNFTNDAYDMDLVTRLSPATFDWVIMNSNE